VASAATPKKQPVELVRCFWATNPTNIRYHDEEWGVPVHDDNTWFEFLILEGAQAGLSWDTILQKRERYRKVFAKFDPKKVAKFDAKKKRELLQDPGIIRNRLKVGSAVTNAQAFLAMQKEFGSFDAYIWKFIGGHPIDNHHETRKTVQASTPLSVALSKDLSKRGFRFIGPTIMYAFMQATGLVNDHLTTCFRYAQLSR